MNERTIHPIHAIARIVPNVPSKLLSGELVATSIATDPIKRTVATGTFIHDAYIIDEPPTVYTTVVY